MKLQQNLVTTLAALSLSSIGMAGEVLADAIEPAAPSHNPWTAEASLLYLKAEDNNSSSYAYSDQDYEAGYRFALGYQSDPSSWGYRLTYTTFEGTYHGEQLENGPEIDTLDLEAFKNFEVNGFTGHYSFGVRYHQCFEPYEFDASDVDYEGFGPTVAGEITHPIYGPYSVYLNGRAACIFGDDERGEANDEMYIYQAGIGIHRDIILMGFSGYARLGLESQYYQNTTYDASEATLNGGVFTIGFSF